jgi:hypothetical protein
VNKGTVTRRHRRPAGKEGTLLMASTAFVARGVDIDVSDDVTIGENAIVSDGAMLLTHDHFTSGKRRMVFSSLTIEAGAFIGARAIVLESCHVIGAGSVVGAGAVVTRDVPPGEVWAGNPAVRLR